VSDSGRRPDDIGEPVLSQRETGLCPRCGSRLDRIRISAGYGTRRGCRACGTWGESPSPAQNGDRGTRPPPAAPFSLKNVVSTCPLKAETVFASVAELCDLIEDAAGAAASGAIAFGSRQASLLTVRGDVASLWLQVDASVRPGVAVGVSPRGLDMEEYPAECRARIVVLCASASREQGTSLLEQVLDRLTPARLRRLRKARDPETVRRVFIDAEKARGKAS
jgi:hypothetical protein